MMDNFTMDTLVKAVEAVRSSALVVPQLRIIETVHAQERVQWRFPRSKKRRTREKWANRECNVRYEPRAYQTDDGRVFAHPSFVARLRQEIPTASEISELRHNTEVSHRHD